MTKLLWLILPLFLSGAMFQPVDHSRFIEKKQVVYSGNTFVGKLKFAANSANGPVIQISKVSENEKPAEVTPPPGKPCPDGYKQTGFTGTMIVCELEEMPQIHQIEVPVDDVEQVVTALLHFRKELKYVERAVIEEEK